MRITRETSPRYAKKFTSNQLHLESIFSIKRVNENQLELLMIINKQLLMRMSHQSQANLKSRTQSATIPKFARLNLLYIYKKGKCVEMLTVSRKHIDSQKRSCHIGYITFTHAY